jgi:hypothetical protein
MPARRLFDLGEPSQRGHDVPMVPAAEASGMGTDRACCSDRLVDAGDRVNATTQGLEVWCRHVSDDWSPYSDAEAMDLLKTFNLSAVAVSPSQWSEESGTLSVVAACRPGTRG